VNYEDISTGGVWYTLRNNYIAPLWSILHGWTGFESPTVHNLGHRHFVEKKSFLPSVGTNQQVALEEEKKGAYKHWWVTARIWSALVKHCDGETGFDSPSVHGHNLNLVFLSFVLLFFYLFSLL
jgi:hypothetical protein